MVQLSRFQNVGATNINTDTPSGTRQQSRAMRPEGWEGGKVTKISVLFHLVSFLPLNRQCHESPSWS